MIFIQSLDEVLKKLYKIHKMCRFWVSRQTSTFRAERAYPNLIHYNKWARRAYPNLIYFHEVDKGGHFAAWEQPELFAVELRAAFGSLRQAP